jgi:hypothetical protein
VGQNRNVKGHWTGAAAIWVFALVAGIVVLAFAGRPDRPALFALALAGAVVGTFCLQLIAADRQGFVLRLMVSTLGALGVLAVASLVGVLLP